MSQVARLTRKASERVARRRTAFLWELTKNPYSDASGVTARLYTEALQLFQRLARPTNLDAEQHNADWVKEVHREHVGAEEGTAGQ